MSTHWTLSSGEGFKLYVDLIEPGMIYLRLDGLPFEARPDAVTVGLPLALWERLRAVETVDADWWDWPCDSGGEGGEHG
jgi:hypothetical protein